ncbi:pseudouridine-5'-phosphate glycosidase, partial [Leisingera sp. F5]
VPVIAYGQDSFPAFWSAQSDLQAPLRMDDPAQIARAHATRQAMGLPGGQLIANPIPADAEIAAEELAPVITQAQSEADEQGISGKDVTPFLLRRIFELTEGRSLTANIALVRNNARLAAKIAQELNKLAQ